MPFGQHGRAVIAMHTMSASLQPPVPRTVATRAVQALEHGADRVFGAAANPLRQLGALSVFSFWLALASGAYIYIFFDTSAAGAHASLEALTRDQPWAGGLLRSLHRYSADAFALLTLAHIVREWAHGHHAWARWFSWVSGVPLLWLALASGLVGYWLVTDMRALFVATGIAEWAGWLPGIGDAMVRNFITEEALSDRLFSLLIFLHIGIALFVLLGLWVHLQRITRPVTQPQRRVAWSLAFTLLALGAATPALSTAPADFARVSASVPVDWFYTGWLALMHATSPAALWAVLGLGTLLLTALPWTVRARRPAPAAVDLAHCNGCGRCFDDCPYAAIVLAPRSDGRRHAVQVQVQRDACTSCGVCVGACPSSTPFRSAQQLVTGIDLPDAPLHALREQLQQALREKPGAAVVFGCAEGADLAALADAHTIALTLPCSGMLPPSFTDYALRQGAARVLVAHCGEHACDFRLGARWITERLNGRREPFLRHPPAAVQLVEALHGQTDTVRRALQAPPPAVPLYAPADSSRQVSHV